MSQNTNSTTIQVKLTGPTDWDNWNHQFKAEAIAAHLWEHITQDEPLLEKPSMPLITSYQRQAITRANSDRSQTVEASGSELRASELTDQACIAFQLDMQVYIQQEKEYREQDKAVQKVKL